VWLIGGSHVQNYSLREASVRPILALHEGAITGLPALLLDSKLRRGFFKRADVSLFSIPSILNAIGTAIKCRWRCSKPSTSGRRWVAEPFVHACTFYLIKSMIFSHLLCTHCNYNSCWSCICPQHADLTSQCVQSKSVTGRPIL
jgi:hypothetical protein